jgi:hypothetical protein
MKNKIEMKSNLSPFCFFIIVFILTYKEEPHRMRDWEPIDFDQEKSGINIRIGLFKSLPSFRELTRIRPWPMMKLRSIPIKSKEAESWQNDRIGRILPIL